MTTETRTDPLAKARAAKAAKAAERKAAEDALLGDEPELMGADGLPAEAEDGADVASSMEMFMARMRGMGPAHQTANAATEAGDSDAISAGAGDSATVDHVSSGLIWLYKKETWGWHRNRYARNSLIELVQAGLRDTCGDCGSNKCPGQINGCPKGKMYQYLSCPIAACNGGNPKRFYDIEENTTVLPSEDPFAIRDNVYGDVTPVTRIRAQLDAHLRAYHEQTATSMGLMSQVSR